VVQRAAALFYQPVRNFIPYRVGFSTSESATLFSGPGHYLKSGPYNGSRHASCPGPTRNPCWFGVTPPKTPVGSSSPWRIMPSSTVPRALTCR
jgi:hypothetical protein